MLFAVVVTSLLLPTQAAPSSESAPAPSAPAIEATPSAPLLAEDLVEQAREQLFAKNDPARAEQLLEAAVAIRPTMAEAWRLLGVAASKANHIERARAAYTRFLELEATGPSADQVREVLAFLDTPPKAQGGFVPGAPSAVRIPPEWRLFYRSTVALRYNPLGLFSDNRLALRRRLFESSSPFFNNNFASIAVFPVVSPAFARLAVGAELQPASFLTLWGNVEATSFFGTFNLMQSFPTATADYSDSAIAARGDLPSGDGRRSYATTGMQVNLGADLQFRLGPVVARNQFRAVRADYQLRDGDVAYYEQLHDVLVPNRGWYLHNDSDLLFVTDFGLTAGLRFNVANSLYGEEHLGPGETLEDIVNGPQTRLGPLLAYTFWDDEGAVFDRPTIFLVANWWLTHRFRTGADVNQAIPMIAVAFQMQGDLLPWNRPSTATTR